MEYDIIPDRGSKNAQKALKLAVKRGFDASEVLTFRGGYYVPVEIKDDETVIETEPGTEGNPPIEIVGEPVPEGEENGTPAKLVDVDGNEVPVGDDGIPVLAVTDEKTEDATPEEVDAEKPAGDEDETKEEAKADAETPAPKTTTPRKRAAKKE